MKAIVTKGLGQAELVSDRALPSLRDDYILVKTVAVAVNPIDWMKIDGHPAPGATQGHDYAGIVEEVGKNVTKKLQKGDRVCGFTRGGDGRELDYGSFGEYMIAKGDTQFRIPDGVSFEAASSMGVATHTAGMGLFQKLALRYPHDETLIRNEYVFIYGGSSASGAMSVQMAALAGYKVIATCSKRNFDYVKALGAEQVFDYTDADCGKQIQAYCDDQLHVVLDAISTPSSAKICAEAMSTSGGRYCCLLPVEFPRSDVQSSFMDTTAGIGEYYEYGMNKIPIPVDPEASRFAISWAEIVDKLWFEKKFEPLQIEVDRDGLQGVFTALERLRNRQVSGKKVVFRIADTP